MRFLIKNNPEIVKIIKKGSKGALYLGVPKDKTGKRIGMKKISNNKNSYTLFFKLNKSFVFFFIISNKVTHVIYQS